ncbi:hypothetical protein ACFQ9X_27930 [Catenulispora yoronensis]
MELTARSITEWALAFAMVNIPFSAQHVLSTLRAEPEKGDPGVFDAAAVAQHTIADYSTLTDDQRARLDEAYPSLGFLTWQDFGANQLRGGPDVVLNHKTDPDDPDANGSLSIAARTPEAMAAVVERLGLDDNTPPEI